MSSHTDSLGSNSNTGHAFKEASARLVELQLRLATHWHEVIHTAVKRFATRTDTSQLPCGSVDELMKIYETWIDCAQQAYTDSVCTEEYCRLQAELANAALGLMLQVRAATAPAAGNGHT